MDLMRHRLNQWKEEGVPEILVDMIKHGVPLHRIHNHTIYTRMEILGAAEMMGMEVPIIQRPLTSRQESSIRKMIREGFTYLDIAERLGIGREVVRVNANSIMAYWPPDRKKELRKRKYKDE